MSMEAPMRAGGSRVAASNSHRALDLLGIELPIIQAPMAGSATSALAAAVAEAGGLGSLPCALLSPEQLHRELDLFRLRRPKPVNLNFFCHAPPAPDAEREAAWCRHLRPYYLELGVDPDAPVPAPAIQPFGPAHCDLLAEIRPEIVSFHFGLPAPDLLARVKGSGARILSSATTVEEALWLESSGCDAIIAQGLEAGGHRGTFLAADPAAQLGTLALLPQIVDAVKLPVIAAGGISDGRGIAAAFALGAAAVQIGTAYLFCPEAAVPPLYRQALAAASARPTAITSIFSGRPARAFVNRALRELGPLAAEVPSFPLAGHALLPLRAKAEAAGSDDFTPFWAGQAAGLGRALPAEELTRLLAAEANLTAP
jgi:nitronate monooxygenase